MAKLVKKTMALAEPDADLLEKSIKAPHKVSYGHWGSMPIIAIGPKGGKIVGYTGMHEPIYAGSVQAQKLVTIHEQKEEAEKKKDVLKQTSTVKEWLTTLGIKAIPSYSAGGGSFQVGEADAKKLHASFGMHESVGATFKLHQLLPHVGKPLTPAPHEHLDYGATMAAGDHEHPAFPKDLSTLKEIPAGAFAGSHGNKLFVAPDGSRFLYKATNPTIARAEEAASRLGRLLLGPGKVQDAKYVQLSGQDGVLISVVEGAHPLGPEHKTIAPKTADMQKHFEDIVGQHVLDWVVSNHDAHGDNFMVTDKGVVGIDKGQAWKFIGQDSLDDFNPNASTQVYSFFWKQVKEGKIKGNPLPVLQKVFGNLQKVSDEQFKAIIAPYVTLRAGKDGVTAESIESKLVDRFHESKSNWEWFLGKVYPNHQDVEGVGANKKVPIVVSQKQENVDTSPKPEAPAAKLIIPAKPSPPVAPKVTGWPVKKGAVTVHHPGTTPPAGWAGAYPGPGYKAEIDYKGQMVHVEFLAVGGKMVVNVTYPDGKVASFDSPNKASDSVYLWSKGLPLDMSGAEKKAKGISYSATKFLNLKAFEGELVEHGKQVTTSAMTPDQLEEKKVIPEAAPVLTTHDALKAHGEGLVLDKSILPVQVQEFSTYNNSDVYVQKTGDTFKLWSHFISGDGNTKFYHWEVKKDGELGAFGLEEKLPAFLKGTKLDKPADTQAVGVAPKAEPVPEAKAKIVMGHTPASAPGPLPSGTKITVTKKGIKDPVHLEVQGGKFTVTVNGETVSFNSLSAASDHVWVIQQGFKNVLHYQAQTGKKKIASGAGWKFWGVKPGQEPKAEALPPPPDDDLIFDDVPAVQIDDPADAAPPAAQAPTIEELATEAIQKHGGLVQPVKNSETWWKLQAIGTKVAWFEKDSSVHGLVEAVKLGGNKWSIQWPDGSQVGSSTDKGLAVQMTEAKTGMMSVKEPTQPVHTPSKTVHPSIVGQVAAGSKVGDIEKMAQLWASSQTQDGLHVVGEKPSGWPNWVPPPGTWVEGKGGGDKKVWFTTAISGYGPEGGTSQMVNFAIVDETGKVTYEKTPAPADKAKEKLAKTLTTHFGGGLPEFVFDGFEQNHFEVGQTVNTVPYDKAHATDHKQVAPPPAHEAIGDKNPLDLTGHAASQPVVAETSLLDAWKDLPEVQKYGKKLKFKPGNSPAYYMIALDSVEGLNPDEHIAVLQDFATKHGLQLKEPPKANYYGAFALATTASMMASKVKVTKPASEVSPFDVKPGENNFETMPDVETIDPKQLAKDLKAHPKKIFKSWPHQKKFEALKAMPIGTVVTVGSGQVYTKTSNEYPQWKGDDGTHTHGDVAKYIEWNNGAVVSAGTSPVTVPKAKTEAPAPKWTPPPKDPQAEAKKKWADDNKAITAEMSKHLGWWLQKNGLSDHEIIARQTKAGNLLLGDGSVEFGKHFHKDDAVPVQTPHGTLYAVLWSKIKNETPEATTIKGPDGAEYPHGTTFETQKVYKTLKELLPNEQGFSKFSPYKGPDAAKFQQTVKIAGISPAHKIMAEAMVKKFGLTTPVIQGSGNTMFFVSDDSLQSTAGEPELIVTPKIPKQAGHPKLKSVGAALGVPNEGQPAPINRDDLGDVDSIIPFRHGYSIRFGAGGVLMDGQLRMHRVRLPDGKVVNRFVGELTKDGPTLDSNKPFKFWSSSTKKLDDLLGGMWKAHDYDPATGINNMSMDSNWASGEGYSSGAALSGGASVHTFSNYVKTLRRTFIVDVPVGQNAEQALSEAMGKLGVNVSEAMAQPDAQDERIMMKTQILRSHIGANGWNEISAMGLLNKTKDQREEALDAKLKGKIAKKWIDGARIVVGHDGFHHVEMDDLNDELGSNVKAVATGISVEGIARAVLQGGYGGQAQTLWNGNSRNLDSGGATTSGESDMVKGGGVGKFFSMINNNLNSFGAVGSGKPKMIVHPRALKKTNWYAANSDSYGAQIAGSAQVTRGGAMNLSGGSNEVMIENVSVKDIAGALVGTQQEKDTFVAIMKKAGLSEINGCPIDQFVVVGSVSSNIKASLAKLPLLKE